MRSVLCLLAALFFFKTGKSQVAISYYPFQSIVSVATDVDKLVFLDYKLETNTFFANLNMELSPKIQLARRENINYYTGLGWSFNPMNAYSNLPISNGYFVDFGLRAKPFTQLKNLQVVFELSPYVNKYFVGGNLRSRLGIAWNFTNSSSKRN